MAISKFGSGSFGVWIEDEHGLPAYNYTCDQVRDPKAITPTNPIWRSPTDHSHQIGNNRIVAVASNYGYVQVRQDEGGPKFLNDYDPQHNHLAGGFGYLTDGMNVISTFYPGEADSFERIFGIGYFRKIVQKNGYQVDQVIFAPFGDDPLLISQVTITNQTNATADLRWIEYWGCEQYQFSHRAQVLATISRGKQLTTDLRREFSTRFTHHFRLFADRKGLVNDKEFQGYSSKDRSAWRLAQFLLATIARKTTGGALKPPVKEAWLEDLNPPPTFLVSLDAPAEGFYTDEATFFGKGGVNMPESLTAPLPTALPGGNRGMAMFLERRLSLAPAESKTIYFAYGYVPQNIELNLLLDKYTDNLPDLWKHSSNAWKTERISLDIPGEPWVARETIWHNYYLRSNLTYDSFYQEHILSQGHVYQYIIGFQGAARDPLQHALPFIYSYPQIVKEVLRYTLKEVLPDGEIPYGVTGHGMRMAVPFRPSDQELWLLWLASEYVLATRDENFLNEQIPTFPLYGPKAGSATVHELLVRCFHHLIEVTGIGQHGLMRLSNGDWNDGAVVGFVPKDQHESVRVNGESTLNAAFATYALDLYSRMLDYVGDNKLSAEVENWAEGQRSAVQKQWVENIYSVNNSTLGNAPSTTHGWFRRGWLNEKLGWIGENEMWLEPQPWAIIGNAATPQQTQLLVETINELVRSPSPIGALLMSRTLDEISTPAGTLTNAAVWPSINGTLVWALALVDGKFAWDEWKKNSLAYHAEAYPDIWYGIWSGPDSYNSFFSKYAGQTFFDENVLQGEKSSSPLGSGVNWTDFPVMNMHPHAWPLYDVVKLIGAEFTPMGLILTPVLPHDSYRFESPLLGFEKSPSGYSGWYAPLKTGTWQIRLCLPEYERESFNQLEVNGQVQFPIVNPDGYIHFLGKNTPSQALRWSLQRTKSESINGQKDFE